MIIASVEGCLSVATSAGDCVTCILSTLKSSADDCIMFWMTVYPYHQIVTSPFWRERASPIGFLYCFFYSCYQWACWKLRMPRISSAHCFPFLNQVLALTHRTRWYFRLMPAISLLFSVYDTWLQSRGKSTIGSSLHRGDSFSNINKKDESNKRFQSQSQGNGNEHEHNLYVMHKSTVMRSLASSTSLYDFKNKNDEIAQELWRNVRSALQSKPCDRCLDSLVWASPVSLRFNIQDHRCISDE